VGGGSSAPPRLVELRYAPDEPVAHVALVGKGITFDSGGLTIKTAAGMETMKCDMAGAATVTQATLAIAALGLPGRVTAYACLAENMVSGSSMRPGDVLTIYGGKTVEVLNTDAEGRLVLADGLQRAVEQDPDVIIDVATLTGHLMLALGSKVGAAFGSDEVVEALVAAGRGARRARPPTPARSCGRCRSRPTSSTGCTAARSPTSPSTTGSGGAAGCWRRRSCASSPTTGRGRTSTSPARRTTTARRTVTGPRAAPASR